MKGDAIEYEKDFLCGCILYNNLYNDLYNYAYQHYIDFININKEDKYGYLHNIIDNRWQSLY